MEIVKFEKENALQFKDLAEGDVFSDFIDPDIILLKIQTVYESSINAVDLCTGQAYFVSKDCNVDKYSKARLQFKDLAEGDVFSDLLDPHIIMLKIKEEYKTNINAVDLRTGQNYWVSRDCNVDKYSKARVG